MMNQPFSDENPKTESLAIRFGNEEKAAQFKAAFDAAVIEVIESEARHIEVGGDADDQLPPPPYGDTDDKEEAIHDSAPRDPDLSEQLNQLTMAPEKSTPAPGD